MSKRVVLILIFLTAACGPDISPQAAPAPDLDTFVQPPPSGATQPVQTIPTLRALALTATAAASPFMVVTVGPPTATPTPDDGTARINVGDNFFFPSSVEVTVGETVLWFADGEEAHTVTSLALGEGWPENGSIGGKGSPPFKLTFEQPGVYAYYCTIHPTMSGRITVGEG